MPTFKISVPEVWRRTMEIEAESFDDAISEVLHRNPGLNVGEAGFSSMLGPDEAEWILLAGPGAEE